jgi:hypothetical protein
MKPFLKLLIGLALLSGSKAMAQEAPHPPPTGGLSDEELKKANNPMASTKAFNVHNYIISSMHGVPDATGNQLIFRYAQPFGKVLVRASMPLVTSSMPNMAPNTGFGDFNIFGIYSFSKNGNQYGIGPQLIAPTGTHGLGQGKWQAGLSFLTFLAKSKLLQMGTLLQWQASFAGDEARPDVNMLTPQIFFMWQLGGGTYLRSTGIWTFDLTNGNYNVPIGLGVGKVVKVNKVVFNIFAEPQFSVLAEGIGQAKFQTFVGFNTQF